MQWHSEEGAEGVDCPGGNQEGTSSSSSSSCSFIRQNDRTHLREYK